MPVRRPDRLYFTGVDEADELLARDPFALLVGFALDQQVPVQTAFAGPLKLQQRLGTLDPGAMATRVQDLASVVSDEYRGDAERVWSEAADGADMRARISALPGFGEMKVKALGAVLSKRFGVAAAAELDPGHPTLGDVDSPEALEAYQAKKRAYKASLRAKAASR